MEGGEDRIEMTNGIKYITGKKGRRIDTQMHTSGACWRKRTEIDRGGENQAHECPGWRHAGKENRKKDRGEGSCGGREGR